MAVRFREILNRGVAIPASPLALNSRRKLDERRQRALYRYYSVAGAGGIAVGVHTTQFAIRDPAAGLFGPVLALAAEEMDRLDERRGEPLVRVAGVCGQTPQALTEAELAYDLKYHAGLLSLAALKDAGEDALLAHCTAVAEVIPLIGFYLQPAVGGRVLPYSFWRRFCEIPNVVAIKIAPFNRYQTLDVVRAVAESGRDDIALYTGNDDNIVGDLVAEFAFPAPGDGCGDELTREKQGTKGRRDEGTEGRRDEGTKGRRDEGTKGRRDEGTKGAAWPLTPSPRYSGERVGVRGERPGRQAPPTVTKAVRHGFAGGLLGHWSVWTRRAVELLRDCRAARGAGAVPAELLRRGVEVTDCNAAFFDAANRFAGCIAGLHEVLRRQGLLAGIWCLDPKEGLSPGQAEEIGRVYAAYPHLNDDDFVAEHRDEWLR